MNGPIYENGKATTATETAARLLGLARVGIAATDTTMNIDLHKGGYQDMFEVMALLSHDLLEQIEALETRLSSV